MASHSIKVSNKISFDGMDVKVTGNPTTALLSRDEEGNCTFPDSNNIILNLVPDPESQKTQDSESYWPPADPYTRNTPDGESVHTFFLRIGPNSNYAHEVTTNETGWVVSQMQYQFLSRQTPVIIPRLPDSLKKWFVILLLTPVELAIKVLKCPAELIQLAAKILKSCFETAVDTSNVEVGDDGEGLRSPSVG